MRRAWAKRSWHYLGHAARYTTLAAFAILAALDAYRPVDASRAVDNDPRRVMALVCAPFFVTACLVLVTRAVALGTGALAHVSVGERDGRAAVRFRTLFSTRTVDVPAGGANYVVIAGVPGTVPIRGRASEWRGSSKALGSYRLPETPSSEDIRRIEREVERRGGTLRIEAEIF